MPVELKGHAYKRGLILFRKKKYALVLAGGGAKGAYQIGAWKAFRELNIEFEAIVGSSVGALNGALIAQNDYKIALDLWENISLEKIIKIPNGLFQDGKFHINRMNISYLKQLRDEFFKFGGLDTSPLKNIINASLNENKIRKSGMDFGILTYELSDLKSKELFLEDIPQGLINDYLLASSTLPGFKATIIKGKQFLDGGLADNIPFAAIKERGYKKIIVVDVSGLGINRRPDMAGTETIYIKNSIDMGTIVDFSRKFINDYIQLGYLDTMKVFEKIYGIYYFYNFDKKTIGRLQNFLYRDTVINEYSRYLTKNHPETKEDINTRIKEILPEEIQNFYYNVISLAECAALELKLERNRLYNFEEILLEIWKQFLPEKKRIFDIQINKNGIIGFFDRLSGKADYNLIPSRVFYYILKYYYENKRHNL